MKSNLDNSERNAFLFEQNKLNNIFFNNKSKDTVASR